MGICGAGRHRFEILVGQGRRQDQRQLRRLRRCALAQDHAGRIVSSERLGLYDTSGNAYEWVEDCWNDSYAKAPNNGTAWTSGQCSQRVLRGGSFANNFSAATSSARFRYDLDVRYYANGFRVVRDLQ